MELAIQTPVQLVEFGRLRAIWEVADEVGIGSAFTFDHLTALAPGARPNAPGPEVRGPQLDGWMTAQALAATTSRLRVGTLVTSVTHRRPGILAKMVTTLHAISGGRAILGVGAGWHRREHDAFGLPFPPTGDRMTLLDEFLDAIRALFAADGPCSYDGRFVQFRDAVLDPRPTDAQPLPILVGGSGDRLRSIVARHADIYNGFWAPEQWAAINADLDARLRDAARQPGDLLRSAFVPSELRVDRRLQDEFVNGQAESRGGSHADVRNRCIIAGGDPVAVLRRFHDAGVEQVVLSLDPMTDPDELGSFAADVVGAIADW
ncbi:MAG: hypothetical protein CL424_18020 [Acidimicrobiaceae bacterium]|nr:hypothetical protein [Acidimicrobiaceae bacterium]